MRVPKLLFRLLRPQRRRVALLLLVIAGATAISIALLPGLVYALTSLLDEHAKPIALPERYAGLSLLRRATDWANGFLIGSRETRMRSLFLLSAAGLLTALLRGLTSYSRVYLGQYIGGRVLIDLRSMLFQRLQRLSIAFYESQRVGDLMSRLTNDVSLVQQMFTEDMTNYLVAPSTVIVGLAIMLAVNWRLTLLVLVFAPFTAWVISRTGRRIRRLARGQQDRIGDLNARLHERLASIRVIQSFTREDYEIERFRQLNESTFQAMIRVARVAAFSPQLVQFLATASFLMIAACAGVLIIGQGQGIGALMGYFVLVQQVGVHFVRFGTLHLRVQQSLAALSRVIEVIAREPDVRERPDAKPLPPVRGELAFRSVTFHYPGGEAVLQDINLEIKPGEVAALVGPSGAGKTSLANLLLRFYDPTEGRVEVDGHDLREVTLHSLRSQIGLVPQETILFGGTVKENILYGRLGASDEEAMAAARAANAHQFITALPQGYDTETGERGAKLSGGQRQRIAVARALLKDPRVLILDEATSSLDAESEALVQEALERLMKGRTTLVIAHRLSTIRRADRILVLSDGRIVEEGRHEELMTRGGVYSRLYGMQQEGMAGEEGGAGD